MRRIVAISLVLLAGCSRQNPQAAAPDRATSASAVIPVDAEEQRKYSFSGDRKSTAVNEGKVKPEAPKGQSAEELRAADQAIKTTQAAARKVGDKVIGDSAVKVLQKAGHLVAELRTLTGEARIAGITKGAGLCMDIDALLARTPDSSYHEQLRAGQLDLRVAMGEAHR